MLKCGRKYLYKFFLYTIRLIMKINYLVLFPELNLVIKDHMLSQLQRNMIKYFLLIFTIILKLAFKYLSWVLFPLLVFYSIYSLIYEEQRGWYSWILG